MVNAWYMNSNDEEDQRSERHLNPPQYLTLEELKEKTGVLYWQVTFSIFNLKILNSISISARR